VSATSKANVRILAACLVAAGAMLGAAFAAKPLYDTFCRVTGFGGTTRQATAAPDEVLDRTIEVRFDANVASGVPVRFAPLQTSMKLKIGETALAHFVVENVSDRPVDAVANYNVTPFKAGPYFTKLECFCFTDTRLEPGEKQDMPVVFYVNPLLIEDGHDDVRTITLSYTFFPAIDGESDAARDAAFRAEAEG
jgi:cytochrome c oxidase assembly protein subunit 11